MKLKLHFGSDEYLYSAQIRHVRRTKTKFGITTINEKGGNTILAVTRVDPIHPLPRIYYSVCSDKETYNKRLGLVYCIDNLIGDLFHKFDLIIEDIVYYSNGTLTVNLIKFPGEFTVNKLVYNEITKAHELVTSVVDHYTYHKRLAANM